MPLIVCTEKPTAVPSRVMPLINPAPVRFGNIAVSPIAVLSCAILKLSALPFQLNAPNDELLRASNHFSI